MKIGILSRDRQLYTTKRLLWTVREMGHDPIYLDTLKLSLMVRDSSFEVFYEEENLGSVDVILGRIGASITDYGLAVVRHFELKGVPIVNSSQSIADSRDKFRSLQILTKHGIRVPATVLTRSPVMTMRSLDILGGPPVVLKMLQGTQGIGVMLAENPSAAESILETFWGLGHDIQIQTFVKEAKGTDIRAFVIDGQVVASMKRESTTGEFRSNIHRGGEGRLAILNPEFVETAIKTAEVLGLKVAGIDMLESKEGPVVIEANSSPGFEGLERATHKDVARMILEFLTRYARGG
ncbi:MAG: ATP-grasp domain-containing protein [Thermoplasmatota archaeon]